MLNWIPVIWFQNMSAGLLSGSSSLKGSVTTIHSQTKILIQTIQTMSTADFSLKANIKKI